MAGFAPLHPAYLRGSATSRTAESAIPVSSDHRSALRGPAVTRIRAAAPSCLRVRGRLSPDPRPGAVPLSGDATRTAIASGWLRHTAGERRELGERAAMVHSARSDASDRLVMF